MAWKMPDLPLIRGADQVILQRGRKLVMENCKQVIFCDPEKVVLRGGVVLTVEGAGLRLLELGNENVEIDGEIARILVGGEG
ncbi:MAG: YabP/YqfC family sporulation protein [Clostridia bacterium]|nr:YabP/YqfC family sporulation protein [Clostridia bacterium]